VLVLEILLSIKQLPDDSVKISLYPVSGTPDLSGVTPVVNAFDTYALEMAARLKESVGGEITVVSIGDESVKNSLKNCLAVGGDKAYLIRNDKAETLDTGGTARSLAKAKEEIESSLGVKFDIIFCGKEATDYASSQVGLLLAETLAAPVVTNVIAVDNMEGGFRIRQETEDGYNVIEAAAPCVVTIQKPNYDPRYPTIKSKMAARKKPVKELMPSEEQECTMEVIRVFEPSRRKSGMKIKAQSAEEAVARAMAAMKESKVL